MMCQRIGLSPIGIIGFGTRADVSPIRSPSPPQKITIFIAVLARPSGAIEDPRIWDWHDQLCSPLPRVGELGGDLSLQVPRQDQDVVRPRFVDPLGRIDRNVGSGKKFALLVGISVYCVLHEIGPDPAVVEQRVAFPRRTVCCNLLTFPSRTDEQFEQSPSDLGNTIAEPAITLQAVVPTGMLARQKVGN